MHGIRTTKDSREPWVSSAWVLSLDHKLTRVEGRCHYLALPYCSHHEFISSCYRLCNAESLHASFAPCHQAIKRTCTTGYLCNEHPQQCATATAKTNPRICNSKCKSIDAKSIWVSSDVLCFFHQDEMKSQKRKASQLTCSCKRLIANPSLASPR